MSGTARFNAFYSVAVNTGANTSSSYTSIGTFTMPSTGKLIQIGLMPDPSFSGSDLVSYGVDPGNFQNDLYFRITRGASTHISRHKLQVYTSFGSATINLPLGGIWTYDQPPVGSTTYTLYGKCNGASAASATFFVNDAIFFGVEC